MEAVSEKYIAAYFEDMERLGVGQADAYPRATHTLDGIKRLVYELEQKGFAYPAEGDVYYAVQKFPEYGKLSGRKLEDMQVGASGRVGVEDAEASKSAPALRTGYPSQVIGVRSSIPSILPFGKLLKKANLLGSLPGEMVALGWHIECSAMVREKARRNHRYSRWWWGSNLSSS